MYVKWSLGMGILDSTCAKTVTCKMWLNDFLDILMDKEKVLVKHFPANLN